jgi:hypothetical protein
MRLTDFEAMVRRMADEVPAEYLEGVAEIGVSRHALPHPAREEIYTLGECIPLPGTEGDLLQSRIVLYHGSFQALAGLDPDFDWREEAWETLTHELQHHLEWRANAPRLEALDRAAEANFARLDGDPFDPLFFLDGEQVVADVYRVDEDYFLDHRVTERPAEVRFAWHGRSYAARVPDEATLPAFLVVAGVADPPPGELVIVLRRAPRLRDLLRTPPAAEFEVEARPVVTTP